MLGSMVVLTAGALLFGSSVAVMGQEGASPLGVAVGPDVSYHVGTEECTMESKGSEAVDGVRRIREHFVCETKTTDPRVTGTEEFNVVTFSKGGPVAPWTTDAVFTTEDGVWRGYARGMVDILGASPFGERSAPFNYGEVTYFGEGAYESLVIHAFFAGTNGVLGISGWVAPVGHDLVSSAVQTQPESYEVETDTISHEMTQDIRVWYPASGSGFPTVPPASNHVKTPQPGVVGRVPGASVP